MKGGASDGSRRAKHKTDNAGSSPSQRKDQGASPSTKVQVTAQIEDHRDIDDKKNQS